MEANYAQLILSRYRDAYRVAAVVRRLGGIVKAAGLVFAGAIVILVFYFGAQQQGSITPLIVGLPVAAVGWFLCWVLGVVVSAMAQLLYASLDQAVFVCPFIDDDQRAKAMSLAP
jgi:hypothetical protein